MKIRLAATVVSFSLLAVVSHGYAADTVVDSTAPFWKIGVHDKQLSALCAIGRFNQRQPGRFVARLDGPHGSAALGVAKGTGLNLYDPGHHAAPSEDYYFFGDGTSNCSVFVGGRAPPPPGQAQR